ncbi:MAG: transglutaminase-like domain-containing protein [Planctomycetota bacterium]
MRIIFLILVLIISLFLSDASGRNRPRQRRQYQVKPRRPIIQNNNTVDFELSYDFAVPGETFKISLIVALPQTIPGKQKIVDIKYSPKQPRIFQENGNSYAEFVFNKPQKQIEAKINIKAELSRYDLLTARAKHDKDLAQGPGFEDFVKQERNIEKDHLQICEIAKSIEGSTEVDVVKSIYGYVIDNLDYTINGREDWGAVKALEQEKGDCSEYSDLFVALCRAKNIPARVATGYTERYDGVTSKHHWAEVYLKKYGWVPFEPSWGDVENTMFRNQAFGRMKPVYVYLSHIRNDKVLHNNQFYMYKYWGNRIILTDSVKFTPTNHDPSDPGRNISN